MRHNQRRKLNLPIKFSLLSVIIATGLTACITVDDQTLFSNSQVMFQQGQQEDAYQNVQNLCNKFPTEEKFCSEAANYRSQIYENKINLVKESLASTQPMTIELLKQTEAAISTAAKYAGSPEELTQYNIKLATSKKLTEDTLSKAKNDAAAAFAAKDYFKSYDIINSVKYLDPGTMNELLEEYSENIYNTVKPEIIRLAGEDSWKEVASYIENLSRIKPNDKFVQEYSAKVKECNNPAYFAQKADALVTAGDLKNAITYYTKASSYPDAGEPVTKSLNATRVKLIEADFSKGVDFAGQELNKQAYDMLVEAFNVMKTLPIEMRTMITVPKNELNKYYDNMFFHGQKAAESGAYGLAYFYFKMLNDISPSYQGLAHAKKDVEDKIAARSYKKISVSEFKSPANDPELGLQASNNIMQILQKNLANDVKIIERSEFDLLMREHELSMANNTASGSNSGLKLNSLDYIIAGDVLDSRTETHVQDSKKKDRVQIGTEKVRNIEWEDWAKDAEKAQKNRTEVPTEPAKYVEKAVFDYAEYEIKFIEMVSYLSMSYRVIDPSSGNIIYTNTVQSQKEAKDTSTSGVDLGSFKVPMKTANLPTNIELSNQVRKDVIDKISSQIIDQFKDQDARYLASAEKLEAANNLKDAVEMYANGIILMKKKKMDTSSIEDRVGKYLDVLAAY